MKFLPLAFVSAALASIASAADFKFATQTLTVPDGFTVEQVAAPPMVNRPISVAFDDKGNLYATDSSGLSERAPIQFEQKPHRIVRLTDTDGDGRFDKSTVFADKMMFPQGALFYDGSLYVAAPPHIWKLTDTNNDGVADQRVVWWDGGSLTGCANDVHGPYLGPDGWFYWTKGAFAEQKHTLGTGEQFVSRAGHIYRARPDGSGLEPIMTGGMDNPVGVAFTSRGDRILSGTFFQIGTPGKRDGLIHAIYGGVYGKENAATTGHVRTGDLMPIMTHMGPAAPCGSLGYRSRVFGNEFYDNLFVCYFNLRKISRHQLKPDGATFQTTDTDFVTSDSQDFRPTDVLEDADGSLLVVDTGAWYKICCPTSQLAKPDILGGIYRIRKTGSPTLSDPRGLSIAWETRSTADLAKLLADDRPYVVERAQFLLGRKGPSAIQPIKDHALSSTTPHVRRHALWALARIEDPASRNLVRAAISDENPSIAQVALHLASLWRDAEARDSARKIVTGTVPMLVPSAAQVLGRTHSTDALPALLDAAGRLRGNKFTATGTPEASADRIAEHALIYALIELGQSRELLAQLQPETNPRVVRVALIALDQMKGAVLRAEHVLPWLKSTVPMLRQTAGWIVGNHADWGAPLADFFRERLATPTSSDVERSEIQAQLAHLAKAPAIQQLLASQMVGPTARPPLQLLALRAMAAAGLKETPAAWLDATATALTSSDAAVQRQAVATARMLPLPKTGHTAFTTALARLGRDPKIAADVRLDALAISPATLGTVEPELFDFLRAQLGANQPLLSRSAAANVLAKAPLSPAQQLTLADTMRTVGALEAPKLLPAFERAPNEALGLKLVAALRQSPGLPGLRANLIKPTFAKYPANVQAQSQELLTLINADATKQNAHVDELLVAVKTGDVRRGQAVFNSEKTACTLCHVVGHGGGRYGPDLTNIGRIRNERELLEAIVYPSATFVRGYEPFTVATQSGDAHTGILKKDAPDEVILTTGPDSEQRVTRSEIKEIAPSAVSPMPPGMAAVLSSQELADLVAFLKLRQ